MKKLACVLSLLLASAVCDNAARAGDGLGLGLGYLYGRAYGSGYGGYNSVIAPFTPPYFSLHPPVYYGKRYARPYGASPFAAWPQLQANSSYAPVPDVKRAQIIPNPYTPCIGDCTCGHCAVNSTDDNNQPVHRGIVTHKPIEPLVIENPYYRPAVQYTSQVDGQVD